MQTLLAPLGLKAGLFILKGGESRFSVYVPNIYWSKLINLPMFMDFRSCGAKLHYYEIIIFNYLICPKAL